MQDLLGQLLPAVFLLFVSVIPLSLLPVPPASGSTAKVSSIEGLRGYLAFFVFSYHIFIWENYLRTGHWGALSSSIHKHLGQGSVELFFMITGYLFWSKAYVRKKSVDWVELYVSRVLRIYPLYFFSVSTVLLVWVLHNGLAVHVPLAQLIKEILNLIALSGFSPDPPALNGDPRIWTMYAGAYWTLPYEAFFYAALPGLSLIAGRRVPKLAAALSLTLIFAFVLWGPKQIYILCFLAGAIVAVVLRNQNVADKLSHPVLSLVFLLLAWLLVATFPDSKSPGAVAILGLMFLIIASGNTIFGLLVLRHSISLGRISYSIYLMHGLLLWIAYHHLPTLSDLHGFTPVHRWGTLALVSLVLILGSWATYRWIEYPFLAAVSIVNERVRVHHPYVRGRPAHTEPFQLKQADAGMAVAELARQRDGHPGQLLP